MNLNISYMVSNSILSVNYIEIDLVEFMAPLALINLRSNNYLLWNTHGIIAKFEE